MPAQSINLDSCILALKTSKEDTNKVLLLNKIAWNIAYSNLQEGLDYSIQSYDLAKKIRFERSFARICNTQGSIYLDMAEIPKSLNVLMEGLSFANKYKQYSNAAGIYNSLGNVYDKQGNLKKALSYYLQSVESSKKAKIEKNSAVIYLNIAGLYAEFQVLDTALYYANLALVTNLKANNKNWLANNYMILSAVHHDLKNKDECLLNANKSLQLSIELNEDYTIANAYIHLGKALHLNNKTNEGIIALLKAKEIAKKTGDISALSSCTEILSEYYEEISDFKNGLLYYKEYTSFKDSSLNAESIKQIKNAEAKFENEKKQKEIELLGEKQKLSELEGQKKKVYLYFAFLGIIVLGVFLALLYRNNRAKQKTNSKLEIFNKEINHQKELVEEKNKEITDSINYAQRIQQSILTSDNYFKKYTSDYFILFKPKDIVSGDFYWALNHDNKFIAMTADCTGHGVPGAIMSMMGINFLNEIVNEKRISKPSEILDVLRNEIVKTLNPEGSIFESKDGMDCSLCSFDFSAMKLTYANANNCFYIIRNRELIESKSNKMPVGAGHNLNQHFDNFEIDLQKNDIVITFTDGYADQFGGPKGKKFKYKQLEELLLSAAHLPLMDIKEILNRTIESWKGNLDQVDDICVVGIKI